MEADRPALVTINSTVKSILKELISAAKQRRSKSVPALCEAYSSLKACPVQFTSLGQLLPLVGFGQALVDELEMQLVRWCEEHGKRYVDGQAKRSHTPHPANQGGSEQETDSDMEANVPAKRRKGKVVGSDVSERNAVRKKTKTAVRKPKVFVPQHRTGTHGILVALFTLTPDEPEADGCDEGGCYFSKASIVQFAQPYSDSKYVAQQNPNNGFGASFHSAWSAMKTLINRGYVYRRGNPGCFGLSLLGWQVAQECAARETNLEAGCNRHKLGSAGAAKEARGVIREAAPQSKPGMAVDSPFFYTYLTDSEPPRQTIQRSEAQVRLSDDDFRVMYCITFAATLRPHAFVKSCVRDVTRSGGEVGLLNGWVKEAACNAVAPGIANGSQPSQKAEMASTGKVGSRQRTTKKAALGPPSRAPLAAVNGEHQTQDKEAGVIASSQTSVIELLTSSDMESNGGHCARIERGEASDSELSDLLPTPKQAKTRKKR